MRPRRLLLWLLLLCLAAVYVVFDPARVGWFPRCPFRMLTGWQCPGCGSQRAVHALFRGDIGTAFGYNALLTVSIPFVVLLLFSEMQRTRRPRLYAVLHRPVVVWTVFVVALVWWIGRNVG